MATRTIKLLPQIFQTEHNKKFLNATLDQLTTEPNFEKIHGYIGKKTSLAHAQGDNYITEPSIDRQIYQLEPAVVVSNPNKEKQVSNYIDILDAVNFYGGFNNNHDRLFSSQYYSYDGQFDFDKFINYSQYYWLEKGLDAITISASGVPYTQDYAITRVPEDNSYKFASKTQLNPTLVVARGGTYRFQVNQPGSRIYIQAEPGVAGTYSYQSNLSNREIYGAVNNGTDQGTIEFAVPQKTAQDWILDAVEQTAVDYATTLTFAQLNDLPLSQFNDVYSAIDGVRDIENKTLIFINNSVNAAEWISTDENAVITTVPTGQRQGIFRLQIDRTNYTVPTIKLSHLDEVVAGNKIKISSGNTYANRYFYKNRYYYRLELLPPVTAGIDTLYYQDESNDGMVGIIRIIDEKTATPVNVDTDIIGKEKYISPNDVEFTNGVKVIFDSTVTPISYQNKEFYVEGVGDSIRLVAVASLITPESYVTAESQRFDTVLWDATAWDPTVTGPTKLDYITINRASIDKNPWSRSNRWFHVDAINATAIYNGYAPTLPQSQNAKRPIIEFKYDLQLYNSGKVFKQVVDLYDTVTTDAFSDVEGSTGYTIDGEDLFSGMTVVFAADTDSTVANKIYRIDIVDPVGPTIGDDTVAHLTLIEHAAVSADESLLVLTGDVNKGKNVWFDGITWHTGQQKTKVNQEPLFDVFDDVGTSFSDTNKYPSTNFVGCKVFSYKHGAGQTDKNLGFPLSYRSIQNIGDIVFENNFDTDTFSYTLDGIANTLLLAEGKLHANKSLSEYSDKTVWIKAVEATKQYQHYEYFVSPNLEQSFLITSWGDSSNYINNLKVYVNNTFVSKDNYIFEIINGRKFITLLYTAAVKNNDKIDIFVYTAADILDNSYYQIPKNLETNAINKISDIFTLGQLTGHVKEIYENSKLVTGTYPGSSNLRDLPKIKNVGGKILQHSSSVIPAALFLTIPEFNVIDAIDNAAKEYTRFKNKVIDQITKLDTLDFSSPSSLLDTVLTEVNLVKDRSFPWHYSDMLAYGVDNISNTSTIVIEDDDRYDYDLADAFDLSTPSRRSVLVYVNEAQLIHGKDYTFSAIRPAIVLTPGVIMLDDTLKIVEYKSTNGCYIPETPSKMGMWPTKQPRIYNDDTFATPIDCIEGHDGSIFPAFGDYRDTVILEFEKRIYNNIKVRWDIHKVTEFDVKPGAFRNTGYSKPEYNSLLSEFFTMWAGKNALDYTTHNTFRANSSLTWNYVKFADRVFGQTLQGSWRAIFDHFYDTIRPHTHPWEMLGFAQIPDWWEQRYGAAPYTAGNLVLWEDLRDGVIFFGDRKGIDLRFARANLLDIIPVNENGALRDPVEIFVKTFDSKKTKVSWEVGNIGPVEAAWRRSSEYPFAMQATMALAKPAEYLGLYVDNDKYVYEQDIDEFTFNGKSKRIELKDYQLNSEAAVSKASYMNWILDRLVGHGIDGVAKIRELIDNTSVNLSYSMASYSGLDMFRAYAEQSSPNSIGKSIMIPDDNQHIFVKKSVPQERITYSAVIVERTGTGFKISGYDLTTPYFTIIPSLSDSNNYTITVLKSTATIYKSYESIKVNIPYGTEFVNKQQVVDFLVSYQRSLISQGVIFNEYDPDLSEDKNFILSSKEFLMWSQQGWGMETVIVLNPLANIVKLSRPGYTVDEINSSANSRSRVVDQNFNYLKTNQFNVVRTGNTFAINAVGGSLALVEMNLIQYEHALLFDNKTVFNDVIYEPETGNRQQRIKLVGFRTLDWDGTLFAPGFIYNSTTVDAWEAGKDYRAGTLVEFKNQYYAAASNLVAEDIFTYANWKPIDKASINTGLLPNFNNLATRFETYYDLNSSNLESKFDKFGKGLIGFRSRDYLTDLGVDDISQVKFYQGYIKEKGTIKAANALLGSKFDHFTSEIDIYENWAVRVGEYGAIDSNEQIEVALPESSFTENPGFLQFLNNGDLETAGSFGYSPSGTGDHQIRIVPKKYTKDVFLTTKDKINIEGEIRTAGYIKNTDINGTIFDIENADALGIKTLIQSIGSGFKLWVAKKRNKDWDLLRAQQLGIQVTNITNALGGNLEVTTNGRHNLLADDFIVLKNFSDTFDFIYRVKTVSSLESVIVAAPSGLTNLSSFSDEAGSGIIYKMQPVRFNTISDWANYSPREGWQLNDIAAIDHWGPDYVDWAVWKKDNIWAVSQSLDASIATTDQQFGASVAFLDNGQYLLAGAPAEGTGKVYVFKKDVNGNYQQLTTLTQSDGGLSGFGTTITASDNTYFAIGSPASSSNAGLVHIYQRTGDSFALVGSAKTGSGAGAYFGQSISFGKDGLWLYVGAPGSGTGGRVYVYGRSSTTFYVVGTYIEASDVASGDNFGYSVSCSSDGAQVLIGSPYHDTGAADNGAVYVYDRSIEAFIGNGSATKTLLRTPDNNVRLATVDGVAATVTSYNGSGNKTVTFAAAPANGSLIKIHSNNFQLLKKISPAAAQASQRFGTSTALCPYDCTAYVGAPAQDSATGVYNIGAVYRYTNMGRLYGEVTGTVTNPTVTSTHKIRINDFDVVFTGTSLSQVVIDINSANIPGVTASAISNKLHIVCDTVLLADKLRILPGSGTALTDLGLDVFTLTQTIANPTPGDSDKFGQTLAVSYDAQKLLVGSSNDGTTEHCTFDSDETTFDLNSIKFYDVIGESGSVAVYEYVSERIDTDLRPGVFVLDKFLDPGSMHSGDGFGTSIAMYDKIAVGATGVDTYGSNYGAVFTFAASATQSWTVANQAEYLVDTNAINRIYLYNSVTNTKLVDLDYIDPVKGKVLGQALAQIDYVAEVDPAVYGITNSTTADLWGLDKVGKVWWNVDNIRYINYEQDDFQYRSTNWGGIFPGSNVEVYEWTASSVLPSQYITANNGNFNGYAPFSDSRVVEEFTTDPASGRQLTTYYYWVRRKTSADQNKGRTLTISAIEDIIVNPKGQGIPYAAITASNTIGLYNVGPYMSGSDIVLHVDYDRQLNVDVIHSEYQLIQEKNANSKPATKILNKIVDSLAGIDSLGAAVPDTALTNSLKYGILNKPRQSMFKDRLAALKVATYTINRIFNQYILTEIYAIQKLSLQEPKPSNVSPLYPWDATVADLSEKSYINTAILNNGHRILVESDSDHDGGWAIYSLTDKTTATWHLEHYQAYNLTLLWDYTDYVVTGYDNTKLTTVTVPAKSDLKTRTFAIGDTVKVLDNGSGRYEVLRYVGNSEFETLVLQNGTINFNSKLYSGLYSDEIRVLFNLLFNDIFVDELEQYVNELFFVLMRYMLKEQKYVDWIFKTSFIDVKQHFRKLEQQTAYLKDNQDFLLNYITETKPYHTKVREYLLNYTGDEPWLGDTTDFDLPPYYDVKLGVFRSPNGEQASDTSLLASKPEYRMWAANQTHSIGSILVEDGGANYTLPPIITITGGGGSGATAYAIISGSKIKEIVMSAEGTGYTTVPDITITSQNIGTTPALLYPQLANYALRKLQSTIKFDRYTYDTAVLQWAATTYYATGQYVVYRNTLYKVTPEDLSSGFTSGATFTSVNLTKIVDQSLTGDDMSVTRWANSTLYEAGDYLSYNGVIYRVEPADQSSGFTSGTTFDTDNLAWTSYTSQNGKVSGRVASDFGSANDRIKAYYQPTNGMPGTTLSQLQPGMEFAGTIVDGGMRSALPRWDLPVGYPTIDSDLDDTIITSDFTDADLGTRAEDLLTDGTEFVNPYYSYGPEELIPGRVFDTLNIQVHTAPRTDTTTNRISGAGPNVTNILYTGDGITTEFDVAVTGTFDDVLFVFTKKSGQKTQETDFTFDYFNGKIVFNFAPEKNDIIYITVQNHGGNYLLYDRVFKVTDPTTVAYYLGDGATSTFLPAYLSGIDGTTVVDEDIKVYRNGVLWLSDNGAGGLNWYLTPLVADGNTLRKVQVNVTEINPAPSTDYLLTITCANRNVKFDAFDLNTRYDQVKDLLVFVNGERIYEDAETDTGYTPYNNDGLFTVKFNQEKQIGDVVHIFVYDQTQTQREIHATYHSMSNLTSAPVYPDDYVITLDRTLSVKQPFENSIIVEVDGNRLRPPNYAYYLGDDTTTVFPPIYVSDVDGASVSNGDIRVYKNGIALNIGIDYTLSGSPITVTFVTPPAMDDEIVVGCTTKAEFSMVDASTIMIGSTLNSEMTAWAPNISYGTGQKLYYGSTIYECSTGFTSSGVFDTTNLSILSYGILLTNSSTIKITTYSNHDSVCMRTAVYVGSTNIEIPITPSYDSSLFDDIPLDGTTFTTIQRPIYALHDSHTNIDYVRVYKNGILQIPMSDYILESSTEILMRNGIGVTDEIIITEYTENSQRGLMSYRMFKNLLNQTNFYRISLESSTTLTADLNLFDTEINVKDASVCSVPNTVKAIPGVVFIGNEKITYWERDLVTNKLKNITRSTSGTAIKALHIIGANVVSAGIGQEIPIIYDTTTVNRWKPSESTTYAIDSYLVYEGKIYQINQSFAPGATFAADLERVCVDAVTPLFQEIPQFRDKSWYESDKSLFNSDTPQSKFLRQERGFVPI